ncbi:MAG TPA: PaaI family thioesterase [bacterium]
MSPALRGANRCFVCGQDNPIGLRLVFQADGDGVRAEFVPSELHVGYDGLVHGGIISAIVDDALANVWFTRGQHAVTAKIEVRFRREVRPGDRLIISAQPTGTKSGMQTGRVDVRRGDELVAEGTGLLVIRA